MAVSAIPIDLINHAAQFFTLLTGQAPFSNAYFACFRAGHGVLEIALLAVLVRAVFAALNDDAANVLASFRCTFRPVMPKALQARFPAFVGAVPASVVSEPVAHQACSFCFPVFASHVSRLGGFVAWRMLPGRSQSTCHAQCKQ